MPRRRLRQLRWSRGQPEAKEDEDEWDDNLAEQAAPVSLVDNYTLSSAGSARADTARASDQVLGPAIELHLKVI